MRRNCTKIDDFDSQSRILRDRLKDKGYDGGVLDDKIAEVTVLDRDLLLVEKSVVLTCEPNNNFSCPFVTRYSQQHFSIKKLIYKHWHIIKNDHVLNSVLPDKPKVVFRGAPPNKQLVAPTVCDPSIYKPMFFQNLVGFYKCNKCALCYINAIKTRKTVQFTSRGTNQVFPIKYFITCSTSCVVYLLTCPCGLDYVGRTVRPLQVRLNKHIGNIRRGFKGHPFSRHYLEVHQKKSEWHLSDRD